MNEMKDTAAMEMKVINVSASLPSGCLYARGRFLFDCPDSGSGGVIRLACWQVGRVWINGTVPVPQGTVTADLFQTDVGVAGSLWVPRGMRVEMAAALLSRIEVIEVNGLDQEVEP